MSKVKDLTQGDLTRLLYQQALPIMGTSFVQIAYSFTDMAWLGRLSSEALAAVGVVSVFIWIANSVAWLNKTGCEVTISHCVGSGELRGGGTVCLAQRHDESPRGHTPDHRLCTLCRAYGRSL